MTTTEFRVVLHGLGLARAEDAAGVLGVSRRSVYNWCDGTHAIPAGLQQRLQALEDEAGAQVVALACAPLMAAIVPDPGAPWPLGWQMTVAARAKRLAPNLQIVDPDTGG